MTTPPYPQPPYSSDEPEAGTPMSPPPPPAAMPAAPGSIYDTRLASTPLPPPPPMPSPHPPAPPTQRSVYDTSLAYTPLPPTPSPHPPMPYPPPGAVFDTKLISTPLPPLPPPAPGPPPSEPLPPPIWSYDGDRGREWGAATAQDQQAVVFESAVRAEIKQLESYFARQTRRFRLFGMATVVCAAGVPVLIAAGVWSWLAAAFGAAAAISGSLQTLYRYQDSALSAMTLANSLESEVVRYQTGTTPYLPGSASNFHLFVDRVTNLRGDASTSFSGVWSSAQISTGG